VHQHQSLNNHQIANNSDCVLQVAVKMPKFHIEETLLVLIIGAFVLAFPNSFLVKVLVDIWQKKYSVQ
jgi:hypothetical protein